MISSKEKIKSALLITLFLMAMVLTYWVMGDDPLVRDDEANALETGSSKLSAYVNPQGYFVSFGGLSYTRIYDETLQEGIWGEIRPFILSTLANHSPVEVIDRSEYVSAFSGKSLLLRMSASISASDFYSLFSEGVVDGDVTDIVPYEYLLKDESTRSVYIYDKVHETYYRLRNEVQSHDIAGLVDVVGDTSYQEYLKISDRFSLANTVDDSYNRLNYELIPFSYSYDIPIVELKMDSEADSTQLSEEVHAISSKIFGDRMDFVKRLKDVNGSTILMYGYGEKALTISQSGALTYHEQLKGTSESTLNFKEAFSLAAGGVEAFGTQPDGLSLIYYVTTQKGYIFYFGYKLNTYAVTGDASGWFPIHVTIEGNQITEIYKDVKVSESFRSDRDKSDIMPIDDCLTNNFLEVSIYFLQDNNIYDTALNTIEYYFPIRSEISSADMCYLASGNTEMIPVWRVIISGRTYIFNAHSGELMKTYR